jgi:hypothetical protein
VTTDDAALVGSAVDVAVMLAVPALTPVTFPFASTVATAALLEDQVTVLAEAASAVT